MNNIAFKFSIRYYMKHLRIMKYFIQKAFSHYSKYKIAHRQSEDVLE